MTRSCRSPAQDAAARVDGVPRRLSLLLIALVAAACENPLAPVSCGPLPQVTVTVGETSTVTACFDDANGDLLSYAASSSDPSVATASLSGASITVTAVAPGNTTIAVTASDPGGLQGHSSFRVMVPNRAPQPRGTVPDVTLKVGTTATVDASQYFTEPDGQALTYTAASSDSELASANAAGSTITLAAVAKGGANITITASDPGGLSATQSFRLTAPNRPPAPVGGIGAQTIEVGESVTLDVADSFTDPDGDALTYTATSSIATVARTSVSGSQVTMTAVAGPGTTVITITATDDEQATATQQARVTVPQPNRAPRPVGTIPPQTVTVGGTTTVNAATYFSDPDGDALTYSAASSNESIARTSVSGSTVTITGASVGSASITVTARDPDGLTATQTVRVTVPQPNRAPRPVGTIPPQTVTAGGTTTVNAATYFSDPDGDALTYSAASSNTSVARTSVSGSTVTITGASVGSASITVTARDPDGLTATQTARVTVSQPNRAPRPVGTIPPQTITAGGTTTVNAATYFSDPDGDALTYSAASSNASVARTSVSGSTVTITGASVGSASITVTARDPDGLTATQRFSVTVPQPNRAPRPVGTIPPQTITAGGTTTVNAATYFSDPDGDALTYSAASSNASVTRTSVSGSTVTITGASAGSASVTVTARDPDGLTATQTARVTVSQPNRAPRPVGTIPSQTITADGTTTVNAATYFSDPDGDALTYSAASSNASVARTSVSGSTVTITGASVGSASVTVTARDPDGLTATQRFAVTVQSAGSADLVVSVSPTSVNASPGDTIPVTFTVGNRGNAAAPATTLRVLQSSDETISTRDSEFGQVSVAALAAGGSVSSEGVAVILPSNATGTLYFGACVDAVSGESNTGNNCSTAVTVTVGGTGAPDLVASVSPTSVNASPGDTISVTFTVANRGSAAAPATIMRVLGSSDATITTGDVALGQASVPTLAAGRSASSQGTLVLPSNATGTLYFGACVDAVSGESNTGNNCSSALTVTVVSSGAPDLEWTSVTPTSVTGSSGDTVRAAFTLGNTGDAAAAATTVRLYQSSDATISTGDTELGSAAQPSLAAGQSVTRNPGIILGSTPGTIYFGLCVDAVSGESDTGNNCSEGVRVTNVGSRAPDLVVSVSKSSVTVVAGSSFSYDVTVRNQGDAASAATLLRIFVSDNATISTDDTQFGDPTNVPALAASGGVTGTRTITTRANAAGTTGYIGECVDAVSGESNTNNNCSTAIHLTITASSNIAAEPQGDGGLQVTHAEMSLNRSQPDEAAANGLVAGVILRSHPGTELEESGEDRGAIVSATMRIEKGRNLELPSQGEDGRLRLLVRPGGARP